MDTKIVDFVEKYHQTGVSRFHMPGHKGHVFLCAEPYDITEIKGADALHLGDGIIKESEKSAGRLFGSGETHFSTEGSSHCIKAMLAVLKMERGEMGGKRPYILAARNVHRSMVDACALLDLDAEFLSGKTEGVCSCVVSPEEVERALVSCRESNIKNNDTAERGLPLAVYLTSPDYLGEISDVAGIAKVCDRWGIPLVVDNAHGAYLHFYEQMHPLDQGAALCCDSAHKTLPVLTGGAYLHIHKRYVERFAPFVAHAMCLFGSTSPSYLVLQSLDLCNRYLEDGYRERLSKCIGRVNEVKARMKGHGIPVRDGEPLKIVIKTAECGSPGGEIAEELRNFKIECEYADSGQVVLMVTPENTEEDFKRLENWAEKSVLHKKKRERSVHMPFFRWNTERVMSIRSAMLSRSELISVKEAVGRVCAAETVSCPPAVPIAVCGEKITEEMVPVFLAYGITKVSVVMDL